MAVRPTRSTARRAGIAPLRVEEFFKTSWRGRGKVADPLGQTLRTFSLHYTSVWSERESGFLIEEVLAYDGGGALTRSWHLATDGEGTMIGLEASQGGRILLEDTRDGFSFRYDRLTILPGPNVTNLKLRMRRAADGSAVASGWTKAWRLIPVVKTVAILHPVVGAPTPP